MAPCLHFESLVSRLSPCARLVTRLAGAWLLLSLLAGCTWHGAQTDYVFGPALVRYQPASDTTRSAFLETRQFPLAFEGGSQWGITVGWFDRFTVAAREQKPGTPLRLPTQSEHRAMERMPWEWTFVYFPARFERPREFSSRGRIGVTAGAGAEYFGLSAGYGRTTRLVPKGDGVYRLDFQEDNSPATIFEVWPAASLSQTNTNTN